MSFVCGTSKLRTYYAQNGSYIYELRDNVGSVRLTINRVKNSDGTVNVMQYSDYYPYGSLARSGGNGYRYDYQGAYAEKDSYTQRNNFALRMYDGRIGRWLSVGHAGQFFSPYKGWAVIQHGLAGRRFFPSLTFYLHSGAYSRN